MRDGGTRGDFLIREAGSVPAQEVARSSGATIQVLLGAEQGMPNLFLRVFTLERGGRIPLHSHDNIEHQQLMLAGRMRLVLDGREHLVRSGDAIYIPPRCAHSYENAGEGEARFLCAVPAGVEYSTEWLDEASG
ncbi:MAG: cupin domain-containing protein [Polyangia bacterium]